MGYLVTGGPQLLAHLESIPCGGQVLQSSVLQWLCSGEGASVVSMGQRALMESALRVGVLQVSSRGWWLSRYVNFKLRFLKTSLLCFCAERAKKVFTGKSKYAI